MLFRGVSCASRNSAVLQGVRASGGLSLWWNSDNGRRVYSSQGGSRLGSTMVPPPVDSPYYHQLCAFDDSVNTSLNDTQFRRPSFKQGRKVGSPQQGANTPLFWDSLTRAVHLYQELVSCPELTDSRVSSLVNLIHNALRINRIQLIKLNKKPDYDSNSFNTEMVRYLTTNLKSITEDILAHKVKINEYGMMHLLTSYRELSLTDDLIQFWKSAVNDDQLNTVAMQPKCVGVMLPILYEHANITFHGLVLLYEKSSNMLSFKHPNLLLGMLKASLLAQENEYAVNIFKEMCDVCDVKKSRYLNDAHLSFIGGCKDIVVAETYFDKAISNEMFYKVVLQVSTVNQFLNNIWNEIEDKDKMTSVWLKTVQRYNEQNLNLGVLSSLNNTFFDIFFKKCYAADKVEGFKNLQGLMQQYQEIKSIDEPMLNIILGKCTVWNDGEVIDYVKSLFSTHNIPETIVTKRIMLKCIGSIKDGVTDETLWRQWVELITKLDSLGHTYIANADWAALRDATVTWAQSNESDPAALDRINFYLAMVKMFKPYCRDSNQEKRILNGLAASYPILEPHLKEFDSVDVEKYQMPPLKCLEFNNNHI